MKNLKNTKLYWFVALVGILILSSCSSSPDSLKTIPKEANFVSAVDVYSIIKKGNLMDAKDLNLMKTLKKEMRGENKKVSKFMEEVMADPTMTGLDFQSDIFSFYTNEAKDEQFFCFAMDLKSDEKFQAFLEKLVKKGGGKIDIEDEETYKYAEIENDAIISWDKDKLLFVAASNYKSRENLDLQVENLFGLKDENQISSNKNFKEFYKNKKDVSLWLSTNIVEGMREFERVQEQIDYDITDSYFTAFLNFDDGAISLKTKFYPNEEIQELMKDNNVWNKEFNNDLMKLFPDKTLAASSASFNPKAYYNMMSKNKDFEQIDKMFEMQTKMNLKDVFDNINGSVLFSLSDLKNTEYTYMGYESEYNPEKYERMNYYTGETYFEGGYEYKEVEKTKETILPVMGISMDLKNDKVIKKLLKLVPESEFEKKDGYYEFKVDRKFPAYLAVNKNTLFITNHEKGIRAFSKGGLDKNLNSSNISSELTENPFFAYVNLNAEDYPKELTDNAKNMGKAVSSGYEIWNNFAKDIKFKYVDDYSSEIIFSTKKEDENSLNTIITTIDDNYKDLMRL